MDEQSKAILIPIPKKIATFEDKKTHARTIAIPFDFPNGDHAAVMVCKLRGGEWIPSDDLVSVVINFK